MKNETILIILILLAIFAATIFSFVEDKMLSNNFEYQKTLCQFKFNKISKNNCYLSII